MIVVTDYTPNLNNSKTSFVLPTIKLAVKDTQLMLLDWFNQKYSKALEGLSLTYIACEQLTACDEWACPNRQLLKQTICELTEYFAGNRQYFDIPLDLSSGTHFQQRVWRALLDIPYGQTISYAALARQIGNANAYRAVANANGCNPISLIIPCHRVIASDGTMGGYTGGIAIKKTLLSIEQANC